MAAETTGDQRMACLEIRGGNRRESYSVELPGLSAWICCRPLTPATEGGDLHYMTVCSMGAISRVVLADVAGHGEVVSSIAERLRHGLRKHVNTWDQSILVQELNNSFLAGAKGVQYATAFVLGHYVQTGEMLFTNAGHVPPLWYRAAERRWLIISHSTPYAKEVADLPLGLIAGTPYTQTAIQLSPGDLLVLYTDGISESRDAAGRQLGSDQLASLASTVPVELPDTAGEALLSCVEMFRSPIPAEDDETMIVLRRNAS
jgi:sigma-B regulation protein RsbU (phosphoserine phosphatase)